MNKVNALLLVGMMLSGLVYAQSQPAMRVRGDITAFDGHVLQVKTRDGDNLNISITDKTRINVLLARKLSDIKRGSFVGITAVRQTPKTPLLAREIHLFAEAQRGTGEGHYDWDLEPGSSMTNASVDAIVSTNNGKELTLSYKGGVQKILVPSGVPIVAFQPADTSVLSSGTPIFCITQQASDGRLTAQHISVGKNGMKPPM